MVQTAVSVTIPHAHMGNELLFRLRTGQTTLKDARAEVVQWQMDGRKELAEELCRWLFPPISAAA